MLNENAQRSWQLASDAFTAVEDVMQLLDRKLSLDQPEPPPGLRSLVEDLAETSLTLSGHARLLLERLP